MFTIRKHLRILVNPILRSLNSDDSSSAISHDLPKFVSLPSITSLSTARPASLYNSPIITVPATAISVLSDVRPKKLYEFNHIVSSTSSAIKYLLSPHPATPVIFPSISNSLMPVSMLMPKYPAISSHLGSLKTSLNFDDSPPRAIDHPKSISPIIYSSTFRPTSLFNRPIATVPAIRRNYSTHIAHFPKMLTFPEKTVDAMDHNNLRFYPDPKVFTDDDPTPQDAVTEIKFAVTRNTDLNSATVSFKVHNLRAAFKDSGREIVHLIREPLQSDFYAAKKLIEKDLKKHGIKEDDLAELWFDERRKKRATKKMWAHGLLKHHRFSRDDYIDDYASKTYGLALPVIKGRGHKSIYKATGYKQNLGEFLEEEGFVAGEYHDVEKLLVSLRRYFRVDVCPTFVGHGAHHPSLVEVGVLMTKDCTKALDHPMVSLVPRGEFLMRRL